jgi:hypothetical protein
MPPTTHRLLPLSNIGKKFATDKPIAKKYEHSPKPGRVFIAVPCMLANSGENFFFRL